MPEAQASFPLRCKLCGQITAESLTTPYCSEACESFSPPGKSIMDVFWGLKQIFSQKSLFALAMAPVLVNLCLLVLCFVFFWRWFYGYVSTFLATLIESSSWLGFFNIILGTFSTLGIALLMAVLFLPLLSIVAIPFLDPLLARAERHWHQEAEAAAFNLKIMLSEVFFLTLLKIVVILPALLFLLIPLIGPFLFTLTLAALLSLDFLDVIWMRKAYRFEEKMNFIKNNKLSWLGFFLPLTLMIWLPVLQILIFPAATVGALRFYFRANKLIHSA